MSEDANREAAVRLWEALRDRDWDALAALLGEDYVEEWPQSGERIRGPANAIAINRNYPGLPNATIQRITADGDLVVTEVILDYQGQLYHGVSILEFRDGRIARQTDDFAEPFAAPAWRAQWVERM